MHTRTLVHARVQARMHACACHTYMKDIPALQVSKHACSLSHLMPLSTSCAGISRHCAAQLRTVVASPRAAVGELNSLAGYDLAKYIRILGEGTVHVL